MKLHQRFLLLKKIEKIKIHNLHDLINMTYIHI